MVVVAVASEAMQHIDFLIFIFRSRCLLRLAFRAKQMVSIHE